MRQLTGRNDPTTETIAALFSKGNELTSLVYELMQQALKNENQDEAIAKAQERIRAMLQVGREENSSAMPATACLEAKPYKQFNLVITNVYLGTQVSFTIPAGMSGTEVLMLIEAANPRDDSLDGIVWPASSLLEDNGLKNQEPTDTTYTFTLCRDAGNRTRSDQSHYLQQHNLMWPDRWILTVGAALFRDMKGFPQEYLDIGTAKDGGELFEGRAVRARVGGLESDCGGLRNTSYGGNAYAHVIAAGVGVACGNR